jgi:hypothetical protein
MSTNEIKLYDSIRARLGDDGAQELVGFIKSEIKNEIMDLKDVFLTKADKADLILQMKNEFKDVFLVKEDKADLLRAMKADKIELLQLIAATRYDLRGHTYTMGLVQFLAIVGSVIGIVSYMLSYLR